MRYTIEGGSLPVVICQLEPGEMMLSESGGRTWAKGDIITEASSEGGAKKMLGRVLSGESLFMSRYTARSSAEIAFASSFPGRIMAVELAPGKSIICQKRSFLASTSGVNLSIHFTSNIGRGLFGGEGFIMQKVTGPGVVFLELDGYSVEYTLSPGERIVCDTGVVAYMDETCCMDVQMVKGVKNMLFGGEGLFLTTLTGPGKVWLQTMTMPSFASRIVPFLPKASN
jgi:uncharacterized protein (TIGR00266 family)